MQSGKIIQIADLINDKLRKEQELEFYEEELQKLLIRMSFVRREIDLTNVIIDMIANEEIPDILKNLQKYEW
jgi:RNA polymerase-interacting CarD/CdnL/TRCF family regulator